MLGKTNSNMGGKAAAAAYVFENATMSKSYPVDEMTEAGWKTFPFNYVDDLEGFKASRYEFATYCTAYGGGWIPWFDNDFFDVDEFGAAEIFQIWRTRFAEEDKNSR